MTILRTRTIYVWFISLTCLALLWGCAPTLDERFAVQTDTELFTEGKNLYAQGNYKGALDYFLYIKEHLIRSPHVGPARFYAGGSYFAQEEYEDAAGEYESFLLFFSEDPLAAEARFNLGIAYFEQSKGPERDQKMLHKALKEFQTIRDTTPADNPYAQKAAGQVHTTRIEVARHEYGVGHFYRKEREYAASNRRLHYLIEEYPESELLADAWYLQGLNYVDLEQPDDAASAFLQMLEIDPNHQLAADARKQLEALGRPSSQKTIEPTLPTSTVSPTDGTQGAIGGAVLTLRDTTVTTDLLGADGISEGMQLQVYRENTRVGIIRITTLHEGFSTAEIISLTPGMLIQEDDLVCCPIPAQ